MKLVRLVSSTLNMVTDDILKLAIPVYTPPVVLVTLASVVLWIFLEMVEFYRLVSGLAGLVFFAQFPEVKTVKSIKNQ